MGKLLVRLPDGEQIPQEGIPGIIHTYAFVDAVTGLSDEKEVAIEQLSKWVAGALPEAKAAKNTIILTTIILGSGTITTLVTAVLHYPPRASKASCRGLLF